MRLFSQRKAAPIERYSYTVPEKVRLRILHTLDQHGPSFGYGGRYDFRTLLDEEEQQLLTRTGSLRQPPRGTPSASNHAAITHFATCSDDEALDFIELCFGTRAMGGDCDDSQTLVKEINTIFEEEGIGFELTEPKTIDTGKPAHIHGRRIGANFFQEELPRVIQKSEEPIHDRAVKPALDALRDPRLATANSELLKAFEDVRHGKYPDAITSCGSAFESVLKTICDAKGWAYDPKDTCVKLVEVGRSQGLFYPFYVPLFVGVGTVRNNLGDAHGKGPQPLHTTTREHAEHLIAMTCSHIAFLLRQAGL